MFPFSFWKNNSKRQTRRAGWRRPQWSNVYPLHIEDLEERSLPDANLGLIKQNLLPMLTDLQTTLNNQVLSAQLPVLGSQLASQAPGQLFTALSNLAQTPVNNLPDSPTSNQIVQALQSSFGSLIQGSVTTGGDGIHQVTFDLTLNQSLTVSATPLQFTTGLPGLGFQLNAATPVTVQVGYQYHLKFGVNDTVGYFLDVSDPNDLTVNVAATATATGVSGHLGFFSLTVNSNNSTFSPVFQVNFTGPSGNIVPFDQIANLNAPTKINGAAAIRLGIGVGFGSQAVDVRLRTNLDVDWNFVNADPLAQPQNLGSTPDVRLDNIQMDLSAFFGNNLRPIVDRVNHVIQPVAKVVAELDRPLPGFDKLMSNPPTFLDLLVKLTGANRDYFDAIKQIAAVSQTLANTSINAGTWIDLGSYSLTANGADARRLTGPDQVPVNTVTAPQTPALTQARNAGGASFFDAAQVNLKGGGMHFPVLEDPKSAVKLFFGQPVDLLSFQTPTLQASFQQSGSYQFVIPPFLPFHVEFGGTINLNASLKFGFDTSGLAGGNILDGFFVDLRGNPALFNLQTTLGITGGLGVNLGPGGIFAVNVTLAGAGVSLTGTVNFVPRHMPADGKLTLTQIQQDWDQGIGSFFTTTGNVDLHAELFAEASITIGKKPFAYTQGIHQKLVGFDKNLFDFGSIGVENGDVQIPQTVHWTGAGADWNDPNNWDTHTVPRPIDDVVIGKGVAVLNTNTTVHSLTLTGGTLTGSGHPDRLRSADLDRGHHGRQRHDHRQWRRRAQRRRPQDAGRPAA